VALKRISRSKDYKEAFRELKTYLSHMTDDALKQSLLELHKKIEKSSDKLQFKLDRAVKDKDRLAALLKNTSNDLNNSLAAEKKFLASMSHEIRTPLNAIVGFIDLLEKTSLNTKQREFMTNARLSSEHLLSLINDVLDVSKIEAGQMELNEIEINLESVLMETVMLVSTRVQTGVNLIIDLPELEFLVKADALRLKQIFVNLLGNASKFTSKGFIRLSLLESAARDNENLWLKFCVEDSGVGIPQDKIKTLFGAFEQAHSHEHEGTGLGLYLSKSIALVMGGNIYVESVEGEGSKFFVEILVGRSTKSAEQYDFKLSKILLIETDKNLSEQLKSKLTKSNCSLTQLNNDLTLQDISLHILQNQYDVLIFDLDLFGNAAASLAGLVTKFYPQILIIGTTKNNQVLEDDQYMTVIQKPFPFYVLANLIIQYGESKSLDNCLDFSQLKILLVEDVRMNVMLMEAMLKKYFNVTFDHAENGEVAVNCAKNNQYDIIFMDIQMPVMDGIAATKKIRKFDNSILIYAMTANAFAEDSDEAFKVGMNGFITKPLKKQDIQVALEAASKLNVAQE